MAAPEVWESAQKYFAEQQKLIMLGQSREEIGGISLLLARMQNPNNFGRSITISGLIYAATEFKLSYRLTASESSIADADAKWKEVLLSMRPIDGKMPAAERPGRATEASATKRKPPKIPENKRVPIGPPSSQDTAFAIGTVKLSFSLAGKPVQLCAPAGWNLSVNDSGAIEAENIAAELKLIVQAHSTLESPSMSTSLMALASFTLPKFTVVRERIETTPSLNKAGATTIHIRRSGTRTGGGESPQFLSGGAKGDLFWLVEYEPRPLFPGIQYDAFIELINGMSLEPGS